MTRAAGMARCARVRSRAKGLDTESLQMFRDELQHGIRVGGVDGKVLRWLRHRLQQQASIRVDRGRPAPMNPVSLVERGFPALPALRFNHRIGQFALAHFQNGAAGRGCECRPRGEAKGKTKTIRRAGDRRNAGHADIRRDIEQPAPPRRSILPQPRQQRLGHDVGLVPGRDRSAAVAAPPPKAGRVAFDHLQQPVQRRRVPGRAGGRSGTQRERRPDLSLVQRPAQAQVRRQQDLATIGKPRDAVP